MCVGVEAPFPSSAPYNEMGLREGVVSGMRTILARALGRIPIPSPAMGVALLALILAASGAAVAAIPSFDGTITACRDTKSGTIRVIDAEGSQRCTAKEAQLRWKDGSTLLGKNEKAADSDKLDGKESTDFAAAYKRTVVVSPTGTDTENGSALIDALSGITDASAAKPYLLYVEPGTYDLGIDSLQMKQHVDIQGAGELQTIIRGETDSPGCFTTGTVRGASNAELRFLTVINAAEHQCDVGIFNSGASPRLRHVTVENIGAGPTNVGVLNEFDAAPTMTNVTVTASGADFENYGVFNDETRSNFPTIKQSKLSGTTNSLVQFDGTANIALTQLVGPIRNGSAGTLQCFNNYDENMAAVSCP